MTFIANNSEGQLNHDWLIHGESDTLAFYGDSSTIFLASVVTAFW